MVDSVCKVVLNWADFAPIPADYKKFAILMTTEGYGPKQIPFIKVDLSQEESI